MDDQKLLLVVDGKEVSPGRQHCVIWVSIGWKLNWEKIGSNWKKVQIVNPTFCVCKKNKKCFNHSLIQWLFCVQTCLAESKSILF